MKEIRDLNDLRKEDWKECNKQALKELKEWEGASNETLERD